MYSFIGRYQPGRSLIPFGSLRSPSCNSRSAQNTGLLNLNASFIGTYPKPFLKQSALLMPVRFSGVATQKKVYAAIQQDIPAIQSSLLGWNNVPDQIFGADYLLVPNHPVIQQISKLLESSQSDFAQPPNGPEKQLIAQISKTLAAYRADAYNLQSLILGDVAGEIKPPEAYFKDAEEFVLKLRSKIGNINRNVLTDQNSISGEGRNLYEHFVARTAPALFIMGFGDSVDHCSDVSLLAFQEASKLGSKGPQALQAALMGWIHDPKLRSDLSFSNLATHPIVATTIAETVLNEPEFKHLIASYLKHEGVSHPDFAKAVADALSINNDSEWVNQNVILDGHTMRTIAHFSGLAMPELGILEALGEERDNDSPVRRIVLERLHAIPSGLNDAPDIPAAQLEKIQRTSLSTGIRGIRLEALGAMGLNPKAARQLIEKAVKGDTHDPNVLRLKTFLQSHREAVIEPRVNGLSLMSNVLEVPALAKNAALALDIADQKLLSYHKILESGRGPTALTCLKSYLDSMEDNIRNLPKHAQSDGQIWLRDVFKSILVAASRLTNRSQLLSDFEAQYANASLEDQVKQLKAVLQEPSTWNSKTHGYGIDYGSLNPDNPVEAALNKLLIDALKQAYDEAAIRSPGMFAQA